MHSRASGLLSRLDNIVRQYLNPDLPDVDKARRELNKFVESQKPVMVQQRPDNGFDCFVACFAMAEGVTYDDIAFRFGKTLMQHVKEHGLYREHLDEAIRRLGWVEKHQYWRTVGYTGAENWRLRHWLFGRPAILQVTSLNFEHQFHAVYWDGEQLFDPSPALTYTEAQLWEAGAHNVWLLHPNLKGMQA